MVRLRHKGNGVVIDVSDEFGGSIVGAWEPADKKPAGKAAAKSAAAKDSAKTDSK